MFNGVEMTFKGHLGRTPEMRYLPDGTAVTNLNVAANESWTDRTTGEKREKVTWLRCSLFGKSAESANQYLVQGQQVTIRGKLVSDATTGGPRLYSRQDGSAGASHEVRVMNINYGPKPAGYQNGHTVAMAPVAAGGVPAVPNEDDIPF